MKVSARLLYLCTCILLSLTLVGCSSIPSMNTISSFFKKPEKVQFSAEEIAKIKSQANPKELEALHQKFKFTDDDLGQCYAFLDKVSSEIPEKKAIDYKREFDEEFAKFNRLDIDKLKGVKESLEGLSIKIVEHPKEKFADYSTVDIIIDNEGTGYDIKPDLYIKIKDGIWGKTVYNDKISFDMIAAKKTEFKTVRIFGNNLVIESRWILPKEVIRKGLIFNDKIL